MWFILIFILSLAAIAYGLEWVVDNPGSLKLEWGDYQIETSVGVALAGVLVTLVVLMLAWAIFSALVRAPWRLRSGLATSRREKGFQGDHARHCGGRRGRRASRPARRSGRRKTPARRAADQISQGAGGVDRGRGE